MSEPTLEELLADLESDDEADRRYAAEDLSELKDPASIPALVKALEDTVVAVREAAAEALIAVGTEAVCERVAEFLDVDNTALRNYAVEILERLRAVSMNTCVKLYASPSHDIRKIAIDALGKNEATRDSEAMDTVTAALDDPHVNVSAAAAEALGRLGGSAALDALSKHIGLHPWLDGTVFLALAQIGGYEAKHILDQVDEKELSAEGAYAHRAALTLMQEED